MQITKYTNLHCGCNNKVTNAAYELWYTDGMLVWNMVLTS